MQTRGNPLIIFFVIVFVSLACLQPVNHPSEAGSATEPIVAPASKPVPTATEPAAVVIAPDATRFAKKIEPGCALISADEALHLRQDPSSEAQVLAFMVKGETVKVINTKDPDWWLIKRGDLTGYARSKYMRATECSE